MLLGKCIDIMDQYKDMTISHPSIKIIKLRISNQFLRGIASFTKIVFDQNKNFLNEILLR